MIVGLAAALALVGIAIGGIGVGLTLIGVGFATIAVGMAALSAVGAAAATAITASLSVIITGIIGLIPAILKQVAWAIVAFCDVIADGASAIARALKTVILETLSVLSECIPAIVEHLLKLVSETLKSLAKHIPDIVNSLLDLLIGVLEALAAKIPNLIISVTKVLAGVFSGIVEALKFLEPETLLKGLMGIGVIAAMFAALGALVSLVPGALFGVLGISAVVAEIGLIAAAFGLIAQLPGLKWLIDEGATFLGSIGNAIGSFIGGIAGGFVNETTGSFSQMGTDLSDFMKNLQPFIDGARKIDDATMSGVKALAETILLLTAADIISGLTSWLTGGSSLSEFGKELAAFGPYLNEYYNSIANIKSEPVIASAAAAKSLAEFASAIPNSGGIASWFAGENSLSQFAAELVEFGPKLQEYANSVAHLDPDVVTNSANAAAAMAEMANNLPNQGGVVSWFTGDNTLSVFGAELAEFGPKLQEYANSVTHLDPDVVTNSANAAAAMAEMANNLPNQGGVVSWFTGDNTLSVFGAELAEFGPKLQEYANSVTHLDPDVVTNSAHAAMALSELATNLPNQGGALSWLLGDNNIGTFGLNLATFGSYFGEYYDSISGITVSTLTGVVSQVSELVDIAKGVSTFDTRKMATFGYTLQQMGNTGIDGFIKAFKDCKDRVNAAVSTLMTMFVDGVRSAKSDMINAFGELIDSAITAVTDRYLDMYNTGSGLSKAAIDGVSTAVGKIAKAIDNNLDTQPTIRPVLDLSEVVSGAQSVSSMFSTQQALKISSGMNGLGLPQPGTLPQPGNTYQFTQNNYSPKPLSRTEIYRQTKNQFSMMQQ